MENCDDTRGHDVNIDSQIATVNNEQSEETANVICDESITAAAAAVDHLEEDDEDSFEDALDSLVLDSSRITDKHSVVNTNYGDSAEHETNASHASCSLQDVSNDVMHADNGTEAGVTTSSPADSTHSSLCEDEKAASDSQEAADDTVIIDEEVLREREACLTDEQKQTMREEAVHLKELGNKHFNSGCFEAAVVSYTDALATCLLCHSADRAIIYANRAAAKSKLEKYEEAITDCTKALEFNPDYMKALLRRAELYEKSEKLDEALEDYTKALERDSSLHVARAACMRLPDQIKERNEKMKEEMIGKLKDLGNMILRPFGLSTNNFNLQQDPATGSYSVSFQQNAQSSSN